MGKRYFMSQTFFLKTDKVSFVRWLAEQIRYKGRDGKFLLGTGDGWFELDSIRFGAKQQGKNLPSGIGECKTLEEGLWALQENPRYDGLDVLEIPTRVHHPGYPPRSSRMLKQLDETWDLWFFELSERYDRHCRSDPQLKKIDELWNERERRLEELEGSFNICTGDPPTLWEKEERARLGELLSESFVDDLLDYYLDYYSRVHHALFDKFFDRVAALKEGSHVEHPYRYDFPLYDHVCRLQPSRIWFEIMLPPAPSNESIKVIACCNASALMGYFKELLEMIEWSYPELQAQSALEDQIPEHDVPPNDRSLFYNEKMRACASLYHKVHEWAGTIRVHVFNDRYLVEQYLPDEKENLIFRVVWKLGLLIEEHAFYLEEAVCRQAARTFVRLKDFANIDDPETRQNVVNQFERDVRITCQMLDSIRDTGKLDLSLIPADLIFPIDRYRIGIPPEANAARQDQAGGKESRANVSGSAGTHAGSAIWDERGGTVFWPNHLVTWTGETQVNIDQEGVNIATARAIKSSSVGEIYTYHQPVKEMPRVEKQEAYEAWRDRDKFNFSSYEAWAEVKFNGSDPSGNPKVPYDTLMGWRRYTKTNR